MGMHTVIDTEDNVSELFDTATISDYKNRGIPIKELTRKDFVLSHKDNTYELKLFGTKGASYIGAFSKANNRGDLFGFDIHLRSVTRFKDCLLCLVVCNCWCKYDIEVPMFMFDIIAFNVNNICSSYKAIYLSKPVYECDNLIDMRYMQGDSPSDCCVNSSESIFLDSRGISIFGKNFDYIPISFDVFKSIVKQRNQ